MTEERLRSRLRLIALLASLIFAPLFVLGPIAIAVGVFLNAPVGTAIPVSMVLLVFTGFVLYHMGQNYHWVELDGRTLRGKKYLTRRLVVQSLDDITTIVPLKALAAQHPINEVIDAVSGVPNGGYEIRFNEGPRMGVVRWDMTDVDGLIAAILERVREQDPEKATTLAMAALGKRRTA